MKKKISILCIALIGFYILPFAYSPCADDMAKHHHGNCKGGMMEHGESSKTLSKSTVEFKEHKNCNEIRNSEDYIVSNQYIVKLSVKQLAVIASFVPIKYEFPELEFYMTPDPRCNAGPPLLSNSLRGPPLV